MRVAHISKVTGIAGSEGHLLRLLPGLVGCGAWVEATGWAGGASVGGVRIACVDGRSGPLRSDRRPRAAGPFLPCIERANCRRSSLFREGTVRGPAPRAGDRPGAGVCSVWDAILTPRPPDLPPTVRFYVSAARMACCHS